MSLLHQLMITKAYNYKKVKTCRPQHASDLQKIMNEQGMIIGCFHSLSCHRSFFLQDLSGHGEWLRQILMMFCLKSAWSEGRVWMQTCLDLSSAIRLGPAQRDILYEGNGNKLHGFFYREIGYSHPPDVWIYGLVIPLWSNLAGTSAA